jgi:acyl carrier protein
MNYEEVKAIVLKALAEIAPEINKDEIDLFAPLREQIEVDSFDFLRLEVTISQKTGVTLPDSKIYQMKNLDEFIRFISNSSVPL